MKNPATRLFEISQKPTKTIIGLMSGTSLDGLDIALCSVSGVGLSTHVEVKKFITCAYNEPFIKNISTIFAKHSAPISLICEANVWIAKTHATMILQAIENWGLSISDIDLIASHGQTIYHNPSSDISSTLQLGDGDHLARLTQCLCLSDFRQKHIAAGGEGAPLAPYADYLLFTSQKESRILLNIGGIANFTYLPKNASFNDILCTDTGPGNTLMDTWIKHVGLGNKPYDENGQFARSGSVNEPFLKTLMDNPFFQLPMPKSTGQETFNLEYIQRALESVTNINEHDVIATLNEFTALSIANSINSVLARANISEQENQTKLYVSGGGAFNLTLIENIQKHLTGASVENMSGLGMAPEAKEAAIFAVLANQSLFGSAEIFANQSGLPKVSFGKLSFPD